MTKLKHTFTKFIPEKLEDGRLYISVEYSTAIHLCACGCGNKVVTPFSRDDWQLIYKGDVLSLRPSIGNWYFPCRSHYWITDSTVEWLPEDQPVYKPAAHQNDGLLDVISRKIRNIFRGK